MQADLCGIVHRPKQLTSDAALIRWTGPAGQPHGPDQRPQGVQAIRARGNSHVSDVTVQEFPELVKAHAYIKKACTIANRDQDTFTGQ